MNSRMLTIAKKDFADSARSKLLWGTVLVLLVIVIPDFLTDLDEKQTIAEAIQFIPIVFVNYVAPVAMIAAYKAIVGERESGSLRVVLGLPATRRDFVFGKVIGRSALVAVILLVVTIGVGVATLATYGTLAVFPLAAVAGYIVLYGIAWTGLTVGISAAVSSRLKAITAVLGLFLFFGPFQFWNRLVVPLFALAFTGSASMAGFHPLKASTWPMWYQFVQRLNPMQNFTLGRYYFIQLIDPSIPVTRSHAVNLFGLAMLLAWCLVPLAIGYWRFERADLS